MELRGTPTTPRIPPLPTAAPSMGACGNPIAAASAATATHTHHRIAGEAGGRPSHRPRGGRLGGGRVPRAAAAAAATRRRHAVCLAASAHDQTVADAAGEVAATTPHPATPASSGRHAPTPAAPREEVAVTTPAPSTPPTPTPTNRGAATTSRRPTPYAAIAPNESR